MRRRSSKISRRRAVVRGVYGPLGQCTEMLEGARVWKHVALHRRQCKARAMADRAELVGFRAGKCFTHQPSEVRHAIHRQREEERRQRGDL